MKKLLKLFVLMTVAVIAFVSCQQEIENNQALGEVTIRVHALANDLESEDPETRTYIDTYQGTANTILWGTGEYMKLAVTAGGNNVFANSTDASADLFDGEPTALFEFSVSPESAASYTYQGLYPASAAVASNNTNPASYKVNLPATQNATASSYDPAAYIMVAQPEIFNSVETDWSASFRRATALNKITLKNIPEDIVSVEFTAPADKYLAGRAHFNLTTGDFTDVYDGTNSLKVGYSSAIAGSIVGGENCKDVWFTSWDVELAENALLTIVAKSSNNSYTRTLTAKAAGISFKVGYLNTLTVDMASATVEPIANYSGSYLILASNAAGTTHYALKGETSGTRIASVDYDGSTTAYDGSDNSLVWSIEKSGDYYIVKNGSNLIGWTSGNNADLIDEGDYDADKCQMSISYDDGNGTYQIANAATPGRILARNTSNAYFAFYTGSQQKDLLFVPIDTRTAVTLSFAESSISKTTANYNGFTGQSATASPNESAITSAITYSMTGDAIGTINSSTGAVTLNGTTGTATVTASFAGDLTYRSAQCSYTITVTDAVVNYAALETSNVTLSTTGGTNATEATVNGNSALKAGTGNNAGAVKITVPANTTNLHLHAAAWNGETVVIGITGATATPNSLSLTANSGISNSTPFTLSDSNSQSTDPADYYFNIELSGIDSETELTFTATSGKRFVIWGVNAAEDTRADAGMSWSAASATATYNTGNNLSFTPLTLTPGNATGISYASTDETIATINASTGEITITALSDNAVKEGSTTIQAIYAGDATYRPHTATYTLTVVDGRDAVTTPTFNPAAGEVAANQVVTFQPTDQGLTFHYTVNGTNPTVESPTAASVTIDAAKTIKVLATKTGYKPSAIATAAYTIAGVHANDGTLEYPYTASEARTLALGGDTGSYYITGIVTKIQNQYSASFGTANFWIDENGASQSVFEGYKIKYFGNQSWVEGNAEIALNDEVIIYGTLTVFNSTTPETSSGFLVSLNGITKGLSVPTLTATPNDANKQIAVTWGAATGTDSEISYTVTCGSQNYIANAAGSHTFTMADYGVYTVTVVASASDAISSTATVNATLSDPGSTTKDYYKLVTSIDDITAGTYVVGALRSTSATNNFYFGKASVSSGDWVVSDSSVTVVEENGVRRFEVANLPSGAVEFTLTGDNTNGFTIKNGSNYLYFTDANNNRKLAFASSGSSQKWTVSSHGTPLVSGGVYLSAVGSNTYVISENSTATGAIRGYKSGIVYRAIYLFKKVNE